MTESSAAVKEILSELDGIFTVIEEPRTALKAFLIGKDVMLYSRLAMARVRLNTAAYCSSPQGGDMSNVAPRTNRTPQAVATCLSWE